MSIELKIKSIHLGLEATVIRREENKLRRQMLWMRDRQMDDSSLHSQWLSLKQHRRQDVRDENRATFLARAYIAGKAYVSVEAKTHDGVDFRVRQRIVKMVQKYHSQNTTLADINEWIAA